MLTAEQRRQRILANAESRLAKLQAKAPDIPPMAPVSTPAPAALVNAPKPLSPPPRTIPTTNTNPQSTSSFLSTAMSTMSTISSFTNSSKTKATPETTKETIIIDKQHILVLIVGIILGLLYSFYLSSQSNFFFMIYFTCCLCILTSRYHFMQMKHRTNMLINTLMLSGFQPQLVKQLILVYTLLCDAWVIFAFYFVSFCLTHVICSLFRNE